MQDLIERLEKAAGPDRELDTAITAATVVFPEKNRCWIRPLPFTASIDAALTLVPEGWAWSIRADVWNAMGKTAKPRAELAEPIQIEYGPGVGIRAQVEAATPAIAICIAALKARAAVSVTPA